MANGTSTDMWTKLVGNAELRGLIDQYSKQPRNDLALARTLDKTFGSTLRPFLMEQVDVARRRMRKFPDQAFLCCDRLALEQSTAPDLSLWKARALADLAGDQSTGCLRGAHIVDLCCGMGGDSLYLPRQLHVTGLDRDAIRCLFYRFNTGKPVVQGDAENLPLRADILLVDPARRGEDGERWDPANLAPGLPVLKRLVAIHAACLLKLPPGLPTECLSFPHQRSYLGNRTDCRELLVSTGSAGTAGMVEAILVFPDGSSHTFRAPLVEAEGTHLPVGAPGDWLYEPIPVLVRSHLFPVLAAQLGLRQMDADTAYLTGDGDCIDTPFLEPWRILDHSPIKPGALRDMLRKHEGKPVLLKKRGVAVDPQSELARLPRGGDKPVGLAYTRRQGEKVALLLEIPARMV